MKKLLTKGISAVITAVCIIILGVNLRGGTTIAYASTYEYSGGAGTYENPYRIATVEDLKNLQQYLESGGDSTGIYYAQMTDIDLSGIEWIPIGNEDTSFKGMYNGNGFEIRNLTIGTADAPNTTLGFIGLFGCVEYATIEGVELVGTSIYSKCAEDNQVDGMVIIGGVAAETRQATIRNCYNSGYLTSDDDMSFIGGIFGMVLGGTTVTECENSAEIVSNFLACGIGCGDKESVIRNCYNSGTIRAAVIAEGVIGGAFQVENCYNTGAIYGANGEDAYPVGAVVGESKETNDCYYEEGCNKLGTLAPVVGVSALTTDQMRMVSSYPNWDFTNTWAFVAGENNGFPVLRVHYTCEAPTTLLATPGINKVTLQWSEVTGAVGYKVYYRAEGQAYDSTKVVTVSGSSIVSAEVNGLEGGTTFYYTVRAYDAANSSLNSNELSAVPINAASDQPGNTGGNTDIPSNSGTPSDTVATQTPVNTNTTGMIRKVEVNGVSNSGSSTVTTADIVRTVKDNKKIDTVAINQDKTQEILQEILAQNQKMVQIVVDHLEDDLADEANITFDTDSVRQLAIGNVALEITTEEASVQVPVKLLQEMANHNKELYFRVIPVKEEEQRAEAMQNAITAKIVRKEVGKGEVIALGTPMIIETNYQNLATKVIFSLKGITIPTDDKLRANFLQSLGIYIEHSDGEKEFQHGNIIYDKEGNPVGIEIEISKFSTFTIVSITNTAPVVSDLMIKGKTAIGNQLTVAYTYTDLDQDKEGRSLYQWYRANSKDGNHKKAIKGAKGLSYQLTKQDVGKYIIFEVTPVATTGKINGDQAIVVTKIPEVKTEVKAEVKKEVKKEVKVSYTAHIKLGLLGSKTYAEEVATYIRENYKSKNVVVKKEGRYYRVSSDFLNKKIANAACKDLQKKDYIINYYFY